MVVGMKDPYILVHQTRFAYTAVAEDDNLLYLAFVLTYQSDQVCHTLSRTFLRDAMMRCRRECAGLCSCRVTVGSLELDWCRGSGRLWLQMREDVD